MTRILRLFNAALISAIICLSSTSCKENKRQTNDPSTEFATYIKAYTGNLINAGTPVKVEFTTQPGNPDITDLFSFSPSIKGETRWTSATTVEFIPDEGAMKPGKSYKAVLALHKLYDIKDSGLKEFRFGFVTAAREARISVEGVTLTEAQSGSASVKGHLALSEPLEKEKAQQMLSVHYPAGKAEIALEGEGTSYTFTVTGLEQAASDRDLEIRLDGKKAGFSSESRQTVVIPGTGEFKVLRARIMEGEDPYVEIRFSEPLDPTADYTGFFTLIGAGRQHIDIQDNIVKVYFERIEGEETAILVSAGTKSIYANKTGSDWSYNFGASSPKPAVEVPLEGTILPDAASLTIPFRAVNLAAVDLSIIRIYEDNVLMFLQDNTLSSGSQIRRSGRLAYRKTIRLDSDRDKDLSKWQNFSVDLSGIIKHEPGAIYRVRISFKQEYSLYGKDAASILADNAMISLTSGELTEKDMAVWDDPFPYYYESAYDWSRYDWKDRDNPMTPSYYMESERFPEFNLLSSNIGIIAKSADSGHFWVNVNDILTTAPMAGVKVSAYNFQLQKVGSAETDGEGAAKMKVSGKPFVIVAEKGRTRSYLKVTDGNENSLSRFDTGGKKLEKGLKGFVYGERGVWRPGDTLHLTLIIDDIEKRIPANHPATVEIYTPQGQFYSKKVCSENINGFYRFDIATAADDPTGTWNAYFKIGGATFHKGLPVETIKPNRLKISTDIRTGILVGGEPAFIEIASSWLTGPAAAGLKATAEMSLRPQSGTFKGFEGYTFRNPSAEFSSKAQQIFDITLDAQGKARVNATMPAAANAPGMLTADIVTRVTEPSGDISITSQSMPFSPFKGYVGIKMPQTESWYETDTYHDFSIATVDMHGKRISGHNIEYVIYKVGWNWWWDSDGASFDSYVNSSNAKVHTSARYISGARDEIVRFRLDYPDWGRFYLYVKDLDSGHSSGTFFTVDWPMWRGRADRTDPEAITMLTFTTDKKEYEVGEQATAYIPAAKGGRALVSIENGRTVISRTWVQTKEEGDTPFRFTVTKDMAPNFYIHITLLQPHKQTANDLPIRMYGVQPVTVSNKASALHPVIEAPEVIRPQESFKIKIKEKNGRAMTYTLAIVDEGLLDITGFKTPDPWKAMYAREALGIRTWDIYDDVAGAFGGNFPAMFSIGGDEYMIKGDKRDNRFNPVVKFLGPFKSNGSATHTITLPMYVGSVRIMVIAGQDGAYGSAEKAVPVRSPLMILPTAPRVLGIGETVALPVNVFAMEKDVRNVKLTISAEGPVRITSEAVQNLEFQEVGDKLARFTIQSEGEGAVKLTVKAEAQGFKAQETIHLESRNPDPGRLRIERKVINAGEEAVFRWDKGDGLSFEWARAEAAGFPAIDFNGLFSYVYGYRHNCTEQLSARGISLLNIMDMLDETNRQKAKAMVESILQQLYSRQLPDGGFRYWPGSRSADGWVTSMAGHFMTEAAANGYSVSKSVLNSWKKYQNKAVKEYRHTGRYDHNDLGQAYRLYTLALAGSPDNGAMNRLRESISCSDQAKWMLASAYALSGKKSIASQMISGTSSDISSYPETDNTYGSATRDKAIALEAFILADDITKAMDIAEETAADLNADGFTTQTAAFAAIAMNRLHKKISDKSIDIDIIQNETFKARSAKASASWDLDAAQGNVTIRNNADEPIYISVSSYGRPAYGTEMPAEASGLMLQVTYKDLSGNVISPYSIAQGTDFIAEMTVANTSSVNDCRDLALTMAIPSGWEIFNERLYGGAAEAEEASYSYNDIRDDSTSYYFDLPKGHRKTFRTRLTAVYEGKYILPSVKCEAMYDNKTFAYTASGHTSVTR